MARSEPATGSRADAVLIGAGSLLGREVRRHLSERRLPLRDLAMMGEGEVVGQIVEYDGGAQLVTALDADRIRGADLIFLAEGGPTARSALAALRQGRGAAIDLVAAEGRHGDPVVNMDVNAGDLPEARPTRILAPHGASQALSSVAVALAGPGRVTGVTATVFLPASERGEAGVEELYRQTSAVLAFAERPEAVFGRQTAFNIVPHALLHAQQGWPDLDLRLTEETALVLGLDPPDVFVRALQVPVFHGAGILARLRLDSPLPAGASEERLRKRGIRPKPMTAAELEESELLHCATFADADGGVTAWIIMDNLRNSGALNGVRIAERLLRAAGADPA